MNGDELAARDTNKSNVDCSDNKSIGDSPVKHHDIIQKLRLMDDVFMKMVLHDNVEAVQLIIRTILDKHDLAIKSYREQININNALGRSVILDILAEDSSGTIYDIEIQRSSKEATPKRLRYYSSLIDAYFLKKSSSYESLPEKYVIFIMENDYYKKGDPLYEFMMTSQGQNTFLLNDGQHIIYVNGKNVDKDTNLGKLMHDFRETNPDKMYYEELRIKAKYYKTNKKGERDMGSVVDELYKKGVDEGKAKGKIEGKTESIMVAIGYLKKSSSKATAIKILMGMFGLSKEAATKYYMAA